MDEAEKGMPYSRLYQLACERMYTSNPTHFSSLLKEFKDHKIMVTRVYDGTSHLYIPLDVEVLENLVE
jgi:hypothetical protein